MNANRVLLTIATAITMGSTLAPAQGWRDSDRRGGWYDNDDDWNRRGRNGRDRGRDGSYGGYSDRGRHGGNVVYQALQDLDRVARSSYRRIDNHERGHIERAISELRRFDARWRSGQFDRGALDRAIDDLNDLAKADQLPPGDRRLMARSRDALRGFRNSGGYSGGYGGGYRR